MKTCSPTWNFHNQVDLVVKYTYTIVRCKNTQITLKKYYPSVMFLSPVVGCHCLKDIVSPDDFVVHLYLKRRSLYALPVSLSSGQGVVLSLRS